ISEPRLEKNDILFRYVHRLEESDIRNVFQRVLSMGGLDNGLVTSAAAKTAFFHGRTDRWMRLAIETTSPDEMPHLVKEFLAMRLVPSKHETITRELTLLLASQKNPEAYLEAVILVSYQAETLRCAGMAGLAEGLERRGMTLLSVANEL